MPHNFNHIPTNELALLLKNAEHNGYTNAPHAVAYRTELASRIRKGGSITSHAERVKNFGRFMSIAGPITADNCTRLAAEHMKTARKYHKPRNVMQREWRRAALITARAYYSLARSVNCNTTQAN